MTGDTQPNPEAGFSPEIRNLLARIGLLGAGVYLLHAGEMANFFNLLNFFNAQDAIVVLATASIAAGIVLLGLSAFNTLNPTHAAFVVLGAVLFGTALTNYSFLELGADRYPTDVLAYSHEAARLVLDGENPYAVQGSEAVAEVDRRYSQLASTRTRDGETIERLVNYPAGHVLAFVPAVALGIDIRWVTLLVAQLIFIMVWWSAPDALRPLAPFPLLSDLVARSILPVSMSDGLWLLPALFMAVAFHTGHTRRAAVLFGLAAAIKQQPWFLAAYLLIWVWKTSAASSRVRSVLGFVGVSSAVFFAINLPFIIWSPVDWFESVTYLMRADFVSLGFGLSYLDQTGIVEIDRTVLTALTVATGLVLFAAYWMYFPRLQYAVWMFPAAILFFNYRSLQTYFVPWPVLLLVSLFVAWKLGQLPAHRRTSEEPVS